MYLANLKAVSSMLLLGALVATSGRAATLTVNLATDAATPVAAGCQLRDAISAMNGGAIVSGSGCTNTGSAFGNNDTIKFSVSGTITLDPGSSLGQLPPITAANLTIDGSGQTIAISGNNKWRVLTACGAAAPQGSTDCPSTNQVTLTLNTLTLQNGLDSNNNSLSGGVLSYGLLTVNSCVFLNNVSQSGTGGGLGSYGTATIKDSTFTGNSGASGGGAIYQNFVNFGGGPLNIANSTFNNNKALDNSNQGGGAIATHNDTTITGSTFTGNSALAYGGGAIHSSNGTLTITGTTFTGNVSTNNTTQGFGGGAIYNGGTFIVKNSTFENNTAASDGMGAAIQSFHPSMVLSGCTFKNNSTTGTQGGAIQSGGVQTTIANSTFVGNSTGTTGDTTFGSGGTIVNFTLFLAGSPTLLKITNDTLYGNPSGGIYNFPRNTTTTDAANIFVANTLILGASAGGQDCFGVGTSPFVTDGGGNFADDASCAFTLSSSHNSVSNLAIGTLSDNGGPTKTISLPLGSAAIGAGVPAVCQSADVGNIDQRGVPRPAACSAGAFEYVSAIAVTPSNASFNVGQTQQFTAMGTYPDTTTNDLTKVVTWSVSDNSLATISNTSPTQGLATAVAAGSPTISGALGALKATVTATTVAVVTPPPPQPPASKGCSALPTQSSGGHVAELLLLIGLLVNTSVRRLRTQRARANAL